MNTHTELLYNMGRSAVRHVLSHAILPDQVIRNSYGSDYLRRWRIVRDPGGVGNFYLHQILRSDSDRHLHNHPWPFRTVLLHGGYEQITRHGGREEYGAGDTYTLTPDDFHRLELPWGPVWSLVVTGTWVRDWGFDVDGEFVDWETYLEVEE